MSEVARNSVFTGGFKIFWRSLLGGWLCLPLFFTELSIERWVTGVDNTWAAGHGAHPAALFLIPLLFAWPFSHAWIVGAGIVIWRSKPPLRADLLRYALIVVPTTLVDLGLILGWH